jgi:hypothetical protein
MNWRKTGRVVSAFPIFEAECPDIVRFRFERLEQRVSRSSSGPQGFTPELFSMNTIT